MKKRAYSIGSIALFGILTLSFLAPTAVTIQSNHNMWALIISGYMEYQADTRYFMNFGHV